MRSRLKRELKADSMYQEKGIQKHDHKFIIECILEITNINIHAAANYYNKKEYYRVLKCRDCNSFKSSEISGNPQGHIFDDLTEEHLRLPFIKANISRKCPLYPFNKLENIVFCDKILIDNKEKEYER